MSSRAFASATIILGGSRIPLKLHATVGESKGVFVRAHGKCGTKPKMVFECDSCGETVGEAEFGKFVESGGRLLPLRAEDLAEVTVEPKHEMQVLEIVPLKSVPRLGAMASYFLAPDVGAERVFALLGRVLWSSGLAAVVRWDGRGGERMAVLYSPDSEGEGRGIVCEVRAFGEDLRSIDDVPPKLGPGQLRGRDYLAFRSAVLLLNRGEYRPDAIPDISREKVRRVVERVVERELVAGPAGLRSALSESVGVPKAKA